VKENKEAMSRVQENAFTKVHKPIFLFKNWPFQSGGPRRASIDFEIGYSDPADFAVTRIPI
jgi:hypothetical protein